MPNQNQDIIYLIIFGAAIAFFFIGFIVTMFFLYQKRQNAFKKEIATMHQDYNQQITTIQYEIQEKTLSEISQKLHHEVKNNIDVITLNIKEIAYNLDSFYKNPEILKNRLNAIALESESIKQQVRLTSHSLMPERIKQIGIIEAIEFEIIRLQKNIQDIEFIAIIDKTNEFFLSEKQSVFIFRLFQESIGNVIQHSKAEVVKIFIGINEKEEFYLKIQDDGKGFNIPERSKSKNVGIGLYDLQHRAKQINATYTLSSKIGDGTITNLILPLLEV